MFTSQPLEQQIRQLERSVVELQEREALPNVPSGQTLSYGSSCSPTITITKTLFSADAVTSTQSDKRSSSSSTTGGTVTNTTTDSLRNVTVTASSTATASANATPARQPGKVAGSVVGSFAAFGMIGFLIWYCCVKKQGNKKIKAKINFRRRKSADARTPQLEGQSMEQTREVMLQEQMEINKSRASDLNGFFALAVRKNRDENQPLNPAQSDAGRFTTRPSWIGVAVSSSTPPNTPPLPRSNSQKSTAPSTGHPSSLTPGSHIHVPSSLVPAPLRPPMKPAPIVTSPCLAKPGSVSPLSPRAMFNAVSNTTGKAWKRASQALSPSPYQRLPANGPTEPESRENDKKSALAPRNGALEIGAQTEKGGGPEWI